MTNPNECAHPACTCVVAKDGEYGKYCSERCKEAANETELHCDCQHAKCRMSSAPSGV